MTRDDRIWIAPTLCGCELNIVAKWVKDLAEPGPRKVSYQHPAPFTIEDIQIVNVCTEHDHFRTDPLPADPYQGRPGYIRLPIDNPTEAQKLYIQLYQFKGGVFKPDTCGCKIYRGWNRFNPANTLEFKAHSKHTRKCQHHVLDDVEHTLAMEDNRLKNNIEAELLKDEELAETIDGVRKFRPGKEYFWNFDQDRNLEVRVSGTDSGKRTSLEDTVKGTLRSNRIKFI